MTPHPPQPPKSPNLSQFEPVAVQNCDKFRVGAGGGLGG